MTTAAVSRTRRPRRPILAQPWFPGALGLWFAALFGLSSLVVAPAVLERAVLAVGLDRMFPAAAPPLGETARLLIAVAVSALGEIAGLLLGRALARTRRGSVEATVAEADAREADEAELSTPMPTQRARDRHPDAPPRRPLLASAELVLPEPDEEPAPSLTHEPGPASLAPLAAAPLVELPAPSATLEPGPASLSPLAAAPLDELGPAQLTERLAIALTARKDRGAIPAGLGSRLGALAGLEGARLSAGNNDDTEDAEEDEEDDAGDDSAYSSLLNIGAHGPRDALRDEPEPDEFDEEDEAPPVANFPAQPVTPPPGEPAADADETDRALKAALASLERFSGRG